jgi:hypothetical protein
MVMHLWRGEIMLWKSYWLFGVCGSAALGLPVLATMLALTDVPDDATASMILWALGFLCLYLVWVFVGIWRATNTYSGDRIWVTLAKLSVVVWTIKILLLVTAVLFVNTG